MKNKLSIWAIIILVATILSLIFLVSGIVITVAGFGAAGAAARQAAIDSGADAAAADLAVSMAIGIAVVVLILASLLDIFKIIGGFKFSLQGKWGMFCIIISMIGAIFALVGLIDAFKTPGNVTNLIYYIGEFLTSALLAVACIMHKIELKK